MTPLKQIQAVADDGKKAGDATTVPERQALRAARDELTLQSIQMVALSTKLKEQQEQVALRTAAGAKALATLKRQTTVAIAQAKKAACAVASVRSSAPPTQLPPPPLEPATSELTPAPPPTPPPVLSPQSSDALVASRGEPCGEALVSSSAPPSQQTGL